LRGPGYLFKGPRRRGDALRAFLSRLPADASAHLWVPGHSGTPILKWKQGTSFNWAASMWHSGWASAPDRKGHGIVIFSFLLVSNSSSFSFLNHYSRLISYLT